MTLKVQDREIEIIKLNTAVVGSGAAGFNAAIRLKQMGIDDVAVITEGINRGTSRNTGSDKQTYYKMSLAGGDADSPAAMARDLFAGMLTDGDNALCEAALSVRCFMNLCELGVEFPTNRFGEYVGYKTDHDPYSRATSVGPLTSKQMTEALEKKAEEFKIKIYDKSLVTSIITDREKNEVRGLCVLNGQKDKNLFTLFNCKNVIFATGGPAGMYADSVFPECHTGSSGTAFRAGVKGKNLTEWQYGLASVAPRWNVSGTYMQVLPRLVSVDEQGAEHEFLHDFFEDPYEALSMLFLKGYQWPFDSKKVMHGSSVIDLLVYRERVLKKRSVYLDYRKNPFGLSELMFERLQPEAYEYLRKAGACFGRPIERLERMNRPAVELYRRKGVDLANEKLEIALCAQHHNGGIAVDLWWRSSVAGLYAVGECAGTHGVSRPGGSALNAGQVGAVRAAQWICETGPSQTTHDAFLRTAREASARHNAFCKRILQQPDNVDQAIAAARRRMSDHGGVIRQQSAMEATLEAVTTQIQKLSDTIGIGSRSRLVRAYQLQDLLLTQQAVLHAMLDFGKTAVQTRGSALYPHPQGKLRKNLDELFRFRPDDGKTLTMIQQVRFADGIWTVSWRPTRPIPSDDDFFENVWRQYQDNRNIY